MLVLTFYVNEIQYAISCKQIVEVISLVELQKIAQMPKYIAGLLNYRGEIIPIIDLCELLIENQCSNKLSTRIIIVNYKSIQNNFYRLGMIAEKVTETLNIQETDINHLKLIEGKSFYLREITDTQQSMITLIEIESVLSESQLKSLLLKW
jgi:chemotaxis-related protein WspB